ncbi:MAG: hypothetical protein HON43_02495 [Alphaproteobacteria bacterium]|nr:hypothetical protein [Alphaproteobacteria bacterium]MBT5390446.1 hypothetical protein [Alphaproteobacteria bacterium]
MKSSIALKKAQDLPPVTVLAQGKLDAPRYSVDSSKLQNAVLQKTGGKLLDSLLGPLEDIGLGGGKKAAPGGSKGTSPSQRQGAPDPVKAVEGLLKGLF